MEIVRIVLDKKLLQATNKLARRLKRGRSAVVRHALRGYLCRLKTLALEEQDRQGYAKYPQTLNEWGHWESETAWPRK